MVFPIYSKITLPTTNQSTMSAINFNDETQVSQLCELVEAIKENNLNSTFVGQPFYTTYDDYNEKEYEPNCVYIELGGVSGLCEGMKVYMFVGDNGIMYSVFDKDGDQIGYNADNVEELLEYTYFGDALTCYGSNSRSSRKWEYVMAGNSIDWWNYVVEFDVNGEQEAVYIENRYGLKLQVNKRLLEIHWEDEQRLLLVDKNYECPENDVYNREYYWITIDVEEEEEED